MKSSVKINNRVDMSGKKVSFKTKETANKTPIKKADNRKLNMNKITKSAVGSIPSRTSVNGSLEQRAETNLIKMGQGAIPTVTGSLIKTESNKSGKKTMGTKDLNYVAYHDTTGVRTEAKAASNSGKNLSSNIKKAASNGWVRTEMGWMYNENGKPVTGWRRIDGKWYYFEANGVMQMGWKKISGKWYYLHTDGAMRTGWRQIDGKWYYLRSNGEMATSEWRQDKVGKWYYLRSNGEMAVSQMRKGNDGNSYYLGTDGAMVTNSNIVWGEKEYHADSTGKCELVKKEVDGVEEKIEKFMQATEEMGNWYTSHITTYQNSTDNKATGERKYYACNIINKDAGDDCSSFVSCCLVSTGIVDSTEYTSVQYNKKKRECSKDLTNRLEKAGFVWHEIDENYIPQRGDISVQHQNYDNKDVRHVEIIASYDGSKVMVWSWGRIYKSLPIERTKKDLFGRTSGYWRIEK